MCDVCVRHFCVSPAMCFWVAVALVAPCWSPDPVSVGVKALSEDQPPYHFSHPRTCRRRGRRPSPSQTATTHHHVPEAKKCNSRLARSW